MTNAEQFSKLQGQFDEITDQIWNLNYELQQKYGNGATWFVYCNRTETKRREALRARQSKIEDRIFALIDAANPTHGLRTGTPLHTICSTMKWEAVLAA